MKQAKGQGQRNKMVKKLRSEKGATITFGLLAFLVCAVLCSVILAASMTAAGRMANMAEADQRYYSVISACELMKDLIDGRMVTVVKTGDDTYIVPDMAGGQAAMSISPAYLAGDQYSAPSVVCDAAYRYSKSKPAAGSFLNGTFAVDSAGLGETGKPDPVSATVSEKINRDGDIILTVSRAGADSGNRFSMQMTFSADISDDNYTKVTDTEIPENEVTENTPESTTTETVQTTTMKWTLSDMKTVSASGAGL